MTQNQIDPPVTANRVERRSATRKRRVPLALVLAAIGLVAIGVVLILVLGGKGGGLLGGITGGEDDTVPPFDFRLAKTSVVATVEDPDVEALKTEAKSVSQDVAPVLDELYTNAFLDPSNWRDGDYDEIFGLFSDVAAPAAQQDVETLTLGASAGDVYDTVTPQRGSLKFSVLFDQDGAPQTVVVTVRFDALGARSDGTYTAIVSTGELFLSDLDGWKITAFDVKREDHETRAPPSPSGSGSPSASGSG